MPDPNRTAYPADLERAEAALVRMRRAATVTTPADPRARVPAEPNDDSADDRLPGDAIGFGLSGGGIRSATFCLGLFQAMAARKQLHEVDFLSTVSGGGYFGSFLGRLFTRDWVHTVQDAEHVLRGVDPPGVRAEHQGLASAAFRWLRENGRYLAPRGSGDILLLGAILLRNWVSVQIVMVVTVLAAFVLLQLVRQALEAGLGMHPSTAVMTAVLACTFPGGSTSLWWSPWIVLLAPLLVLWAAPAGWAYWLVGGRAGTISERSPKLGAGFVALVGAVAAIWYRPALLFVVVSGLAFLFWLAGRPRGDRAGTVEAANLQRNRLTHHLTSGLLASGVVLAWTAIDTVGGTLYAVAISDDISLAGWGAGVFGTFAAIGAMARPVALWFGARRGAARPGVPLSVISWVATVVMLVVWLTSINVASHAVAWNFRAPIGHPVGLAERAAPTVLGANRIEITPTGAGFAVSAAMSEPPCTVPLPVKRPAPWLGLIALAVLASLTWLFGHVRTFANMSSIHAFYAARLTRTFLGATNATRMRDAVGVSDTVDGDDCPATAYWCWPSHFPSQTTSAAPAGAAEGSPASAPVVTGPWTKGGPLHLLNVTVNETVDARTKTQNQDRKGTGLAFGPCGMSLGIRHHLVQPHNEEVRAHPPVPQVPGSGAPHRVFRPEDPASRPPDALSLGRWMSVSGAAFTAAAGANTTVPMALLSGLFNVRLGYWWDSGTPFDKRSPWERVLPVQTALLSEALARTHGTSGRLWNLSDGGHFENMGGYELVRRRLPIIVIVDAEADPDYTFQGLSDLVRKARLDFGAETDFLSDEALAGLVTTAQGQTVPAVPESVRGCFGSLEALRRGRWSDEPIPLPDGSARKRYSIEVDRARHSRAHAALARVTYRDNGDVCWLVYVKATLMGDEPEDVSQYHRAHPEFPQETTTDQFFDEAQWESYRRLGQHIGHRVLTPELFAHLRAAPAATVRAGFGG